MLASGGTGLLGGGLPARCRRGVRGLDGRHMAFIKDAQGGDDVIFPAASLR